jgi:hypothetical protein
MANKRQKTGDLVDELKSNAFLKAIGAVSNMDNYRGLAKRRTAPPTKTSSSASRPDSASGMYSSELQNRTAPTAKKVAKKPAAKKTSPAASHGGY